MIRSRKGDIPLAALFVIAIVLVIVAWISFFSSHGNLDEKAKEITNTITQLDFSQEYMIAEAVNIGNETLNTGVSDSALKSKFQEIASAHNLNIDQEGNLFAKVRNGDFTFNKQGQDYVLSIEGLNVEAKSVTVDLKRVYDLEIRFVPEIGKSGRFDITFINKG